MKKIRENLGKNREKNLGNVSGTGFLSLFALAPGGVQRCPAAVGGSWPHPVAPGGLRPFPRSPASSRWLPWVPGGARGPPAASGGSRCFFARQAFPAMWGCRGRTKKKRDSICYVVIRFSEAVLATFARIIPCPIISFSKWGKNEKIIKKNRPRSKKKI